MMNPGSPSPRPPASRRRHSRRDAVFALAALLAAAHPFPALAARSGSGGGVHSSPTTTAASRLSTPTLPSPTVGRASDSDVAELSAQSQLDRLATASAQSYEIVPPTPPGPAPAGPLPGYQIVRLGRGHFNRLCLAGTVAGIKGLMMLDTGANNTALSEVTYHSLLLNSSAHLPSGLPQAVSLNGTRTPLVEAPDFRVGKSNLGAVPVSLLPRRYLFDASPLDGRGRLYDGLMGENILRHYHAIIDCGRLVLYLNIDPARKLDLSASFAREGWTRVAMSDLGNDFAVPCVLNGQPFRLIVDTGSPFTNLDRNLLTAAKIGSHDLAARGGLIGTSSVQAGLVDLDRLQIGDYMATGIHMTATPQSLSAFERGRDGSSGGPIVGLLGGDILADNRAVIDLGNRALYLKHPGGKTTRGQ